MEVNVEETPSDDRLPLAPHKPMKSTDRPERPNRELKRRTHVVQIFPNAESCLRLICALAVETQKNWLKATRSLDMTPLAEHEKDAIRRIEQAQAA